MTIRARLARPWWCLALALFILPVVAHAQEVANVGFRAISVHDPVSDGAMPGFVFYPSVLPRGLTQLGPYDIDAALDAAAMPGARPLVLISHGHGGSALGHHDLAVYLASHGFVVATLEHPSDNFHDASGNGRSTVLAGRPVQVRATMAYLLTDPQWKGMIDTSRVGVAGFSMGGYTSLLLVGAVPRFDRLIGYCKQYPDDQATCGLLSQPAQDGLTAESYLDALQNDLHRWGRTDDPRIRAAFVMAPTSFLFDESGLATIDRPVFLYYAEDDIVLLPVANVLHIAPLMRTVVGIEMIPGAGHYVFMPPCSPRLVEAAPDSCGETAGVDRAEVHDRINADALAFFRRSLDLPSP